MRLQQYPPSPRRRRVEKVEPIAVESDTDAPAMSIEDIDELLEEIDALLEDQAVLTNFRQRSGQ